MKPCRKYPRQFDALYTSLVAVGERSGNLDDLMDKVALYMENIEEIKAKVKGALWYPAAVLAVGFIVTVLLLVFVIPQFEDLFSSFGASLPALTAIVIELSQGFRELSLRSSLSSSELLSPFRCPTGDPRRCGIG